MTAARGEHVDVITGVRLRAALRTDPFEDEPVDVHLVGGMIVDIAPAGALRRRGRVLDAAGGYLIPGLWDHHVHTVQWALAGVREPLGEAATAADAARIMAAVPVQADGRRVGTGFRDALWPDRPDLEMLDAATGDIPTYLINSDVHSVWLNSAALRREGMSSADGVLREAPAFEVSRRLNAVDVAVSDALVARMGEEAAARGVVGIVDLDMAWNEEAWGRRLAAGFDALRVEFGVYPDLLDRAIAEGLRTGDRVRGSDSDLARVGALKVITDGSLGTRTAACSHPYPTGPHDRGQLTVGADELVDLMTRATGAGLASAIHAIGDIANSQALDAFALTGATGTIEHAQLVAAADIPRFARVGVGASVQPEHALDDRDMTDELWVLQTAVPYPLRVLADAGANLLLGSDAPVAPLDPWAAMAAAVFRSRDGRPAWRPGDAIDLTTALGASGHGGSQHPSEITPGGTADLVVCAADPFAQHADGLRGMRTVATMLAGRLTHLA